MTHAATRGYDGTTLQDIAGAIGITRPGRYHYISSKEQLLPNSSGTSARSPRIIHEIRLHTSLSSVEKPQAVVRALVLQRAGAPERFRVLNRTEAAFPDETAALHLKARPEVLAEMKTIIEEGVSSGEFCPPGPAAGSAVGHRHVQLGRLVVHPGTSHPAEPVADQLAQNSIDMLAYPEGTGSPTTTGPQRALQTVRENLDYLERLLSPESVHNFGPTTVQPSHGSASPDSRP